MPRQSLNVLLIEDDPAACRLVERTLSCSDEPIDYIVDVAHNLKTAEHYLQCKNFDSVLLDLQLPDSTGIDSLVRIKKLNPDLPVIVLSEISDHKTCMQAIKEGADYYLVKGRFMREMLGRSICFSVVRGKSDSVAVANNEQKHKQIQDRLTSQVKELSNIAKNAIAERDSLKSHMSKLKKQFDAIFDSIPSMIWLRDLKGKIITSNKRARQFFYESIRTVDQSDPAKIFSQVLKLTDEEDKFIIASGCPLPSKCIQYVNEEGKTLQCEVDCLPYHDDKGEVVGTVVYVKELPESVTAVQNEVVDAGEELQLAQQQTEPEVVEQVQEQDDIIMLEEDVEQEVSKEPAKPRTNRVLVVEDDPLNQMLMNLHLNALAVDITTVDNGEKAIEKVSEQEFDLILMDIRMPVLNGRQATRQMRQMGITTPIIATTADVVGNARQRCLDAGCNGFICKPIIKKEFYELIGRYMDISGAGLRYRNRYSQKDQVYIEL